MNDSPTPKIVELLKGYGDQGLSFERAKEELFDLGYTSEEIDDAADNYTYGFKPTPDILLKNEEYFNTHPQQAAKDGYQVAKAVRQEVVTDERIQAEADIAGAVMAPRVDNYDIQGSIEYGQRFAQDVGVSYWILTALFFLVNVVAFLLVTFLNISSWLYTVNLVLTLGLIILLIRRIR
jgi:hypothetical protein